MAREVDSAIHAKLLPIVFGLGLLAVVTYAVRSLMWGGRMIPGVVACGVVVSGLVLFLDKNYWILPAALFAFHDVLPRIKFTGMELGALILIATFFVRLALRRERLLIPQFRPLLLTLPFMAWMMLVWGLHPTGMRIFGSSTFGGRFYFDVLLAFFSLVILSVTCIDERDSKLLFWSFVAGIVLDVGLKLWLWDEENSIYGTEVHYKYNHLSYLTSLILCRFAPLELMLRPVLFPLFLILFGLTVFSGNRTSAARPAVAGLLYPFFVGRRRASTVVIGVLGALALAVLIIGHGSIWHLPYSIQRSLSFLPGKWERRLENYGFQDDFRSELRRIARDHIRARPWFGDGGFALDVSQIAWMGEDTFSNVIISHSIARNWHNVWLGMAADFGIPLSVSWALFTAGILWFGYGNRKKVAPRSWNETMYMYFYVMIVVEFLNSFFNGGHTAHTAEQIFVWTGLLLAVLNGAEGNTRSSQLSGDGSSPGKNRLVSSNGRFGT